MGVKLPYEFGTQNVGSANFPPQLMADLQAITNGTRTILPDSRWPGGTVGGVTYGAIFYVATNGSDTTGDGTQANPWLTPAHADIQINTLFDFGGQNVLLQAISGHAAFTSQLPISSWSGGGSLTYDGAGGSISTTSASAIKTSGGALLGPFTYQNVTLSTTTSGHNVEHSVAGNLIQGAGVTHGACAGGHLRPLFNPAARITLANSYTISGGALGHYFLGASVVDGGSNSITVTLTGNPQFSNAFAFVANGIVDLTGTIFSGTATGYQSGKALLNGILFRNNPNNPLPGNGVVSLQTGGQFVA